MRSAGNTHIHSIAGGFVFLLLGLFAVMSCVLVLFGVRAYRASVQAAERNNEERILSAYVRSMIRSEDRQGLVSVEHFSDVDTVTLTQRYEGRAYVTRIYSYNGSLMEWFAEAERDFAPENGEVICGCGGFSPSLEDGLLTLEMLTGADAGSEPLTVSIALFSAQEEAEDPALAMQEEAA